MSIILGPRATLFPMMALGTAVTKIAVCILFPTKHHTHESEMFSYMKNTYVQPLTQAASVAVVTQSPMVFYLSML